MMIPLSFLVFIFGTIIGSFLNVVIDRADMKESPVKGHSFCPHCHKTLAWWELIPILSFFLLKGKCSSCKHKLSWQYPLVETGTGLFFALLFWRFLRFPLINFSLLQNITFENLFIYLVFFVWLYWIAVLIIISVYDFKKYLILNEVLILQNQSMSTQSRLTNNHWQVKQSTQPRPILSFPPKCISFYLREGEQWM